MKKIFAVVVLTSFLISCKKDLTEQQMDEVKTDPLKSIKEINT